MCRFLLPMIFVVTIVNSNLFAQSVDFFRLAPGGDFRNPSLWTPFDPVNPPILLGPGGASDRANFDLGYGLLNTYTIVGVNGVNDQLIVHNDSVRLEITDYQLLRSSAYENAGIVVSESPGDLGILFLGGDSGAQLTSSTTYLAVGSGTTGSIIVDSPDLTWNNTGPIIAGAGGIGTFQIRGGHVESGFAAIGGPGSTGFGRITGPNSFWDINSTLTIGNNYSTGTLVIEDGARVCAEELALGQIDFDSEGELTIDGPGSELDVDGPVHIGGQGVGYVTVRNGGKLDTNFGSLIIGEHGVGTAIIQDGATVECGAANIGDMADGDGYLLVEGSSTSLSTSNTVRVGFEGSGTMHVSHEAEVSSPALVIGHQARSDGSILQYGYWTTSGVQIIGRAGNGFLGIGPNETICRDNAFIGRFAGSDGAVRVSTGIWQVEKNLVIGGNLDPNPVSGGIGELDFGATGGFVDIWEDLIVISNGTVNLSSGSELSANRIDLVDGGSLNMTLDGILHVDQMLDSLTNEGGILAPGNVPLYSSPIGGSTIDGDYTQQQEAAMQIQVQGVGAGTGYDVVTITGDAFFDGNLDVELLKGFLPSVNDTFEIVNLTTGSIFGFFNNIGDNERLETTDGSGSFLVRYGITSPNPDKVILSEFEPSFVLGDVNGDGVVNLLDVAPFVEAVSTGLYNPAADINQDGQVNLLDVAPFIELLNG